MARPAVSILIPAFRPDWLDTAVASALAQTHSDFELLVSDDSLGDDVASVMAKWDDSRIRYFRNPAQGEPGSNRDHLINEARGEYLKFLFDDDFLLPKSVEILLGGACSTGAGLAFHSRHMVDEKGRIMASPQLMSAGACQLLSSEFFFEKIIGQAMNYIGEPTNILIRADKLRSMSGPFAIDGRRMRFLTDVALYTNFFSQDLGVVGLGYFGSAFRQHSSQTSSNAYLGYSAGHYEWELLQRWSVDAGLMKRQTFLNGRSARLAQYSKWSSDFPELTNFMKLGAGDADEIYLNDEFVEALRLADLTIGMRKLNSE